MMMINKNHISTQNHLVVLLADDIKCILLLFNLETNFEVKTWFEILQTPLS